MRAIVTNRRFGHGAAGPLSARGSRGQAYRSPAAPRQRAMPAKRSATARSNCPANYCQSATFGFGAQVFPIDVATLNRRSSPWGYFDTRTERRVGDTSSRDSYSSSATTPSSSRCSSAGRSASGPSERTEVTLPDKSHEGRVATRRVRSAVRFPRGARSVT